MSWAKEFQEKLAEKLELWERVIEHKMVTGQRRQELEKLAKRTVSTFHSVIARLSRDVLPGSNPSREFFDLLGDIQSNSDEMSSYNPFVNPHLSDRQAEILNTVHAYAYEEIPRYRQLITTLVEEQERLRWQQVANTQNQIDQLEQWKWDQLLKLEKTYHGFTAYGDYAPEPGYSDQRGYPYVDPYRAIIADKLREWGIPFNPLVPFEITCPIPGVFDGQLYASFKIGDRLFLHVERYQRFVSEPKLEKDHSFHEMKNRRRFIVSYNKNQLDHHKFLRPTDFDTVGNRLDLKANGYFKLQQWLNLSGYAVTLKSGPPVRVQLPGDSRRTHIAELLYQEGIFIESLGLEVEQLRIWQRPLDTISKAIAEALPLFWRAFREELAQRNIVRFHDVLTALRNPDMLYRLQDKLKLLRHLFIDEFQDISPEIVEWLSKTVSVHAGSGAEVSVIGIGDDYQSIYGWRGSQPIFLLNFVQYFTIRPIGNVDLIDNFRSRQPIIDAAEAALVPVRIKKQKHGISTFNAIDSRRLDPVRLVEAQLTWNSSSRETDLWQTFCNFVTMLLRDLESAGNLSQMIGSRKTLIVFILTRTNQALAAIPHRDRLQAQLRRALFEGGVKQFQEVHIQPRTFHTAKGLESDVVLMLEDSLPPDEHPLRELVFSQAPFHGQDVTYMQTMSDESRRLAYVALTRARLGVMWVPLTHSSQEENEAQPDAKSNHQENAIIAPQGCFVLVRQYLQANGRMQ